MHATNVIRWSFAPALAAALIGAGCAGVEHSGSEDSELRSCGALPASVEQRFEAMRGPLGCAASTTPLPDPPGGCAGADELLASARREYAALWARGGCGSAPPDLAPYVTAYLDRFAAHHRFVAHQITRDGFAIAAREFGAGHANGPLIVLMHGFPDNQHLYDLVAPRLAETHHVVTFDFVGWGDSSKPSADHVFSFADLRKDLEAVLAHFAATQVVPVVHDASGWPGIDWALDHPDTVAALVLLNTTYQPIPGGGPPNVIRALSALDLRPAFLAAAGTDDLLMTHSLFRAQVSRFFSREAARRSFLPLFEHDFPAARPGMFGLTATLLQTAAARTANVARMQAYPRPVTVAFGADDPALNPQVARGLAASFHGARLELLRDAGHYVQLDQPDRVAEIIRAAASRAPAAAR
jgi:haloalkane dehalogenase